MEVREIFENSEATIVLQNNHDLTCVLGYLVDNILNFETVKLLLEFLALGPKLSARTPC